MKGPPPDFKFDMPFPLWLQFYIANSVRSDPSPGEMADWNPNNISTYLGRTLKISGGTPKGIEKIVKGETRGTKFGRPIITAVTSSAEAKYIQEWEELLVPAFSKWSSISNDRSLISSIETACTSLGLPQNYAARQTEFRKWQNSGPDAVNKSFDALLNDSLFSEGKSRRVIFKRVAVLAIASVMLFLLTLVLSDTPSVKTVLALREPAFFDEYKKMVSRFKEQGLVHQNLRPFIYLPTWQGQVSESYLAFLSDHLDQQIAIFDAQNIYLISIQDKQADQSIYYEESFFEIFDDQQTSFMQRSEVFFQANLQSRKDANFRILRGLGQLQNLMNNPFQCRLAFLVELPVRSAIAKSSDLNLGIWQDDIKRGHASPSVEIFFDNLHTLLDTDGMLAALDIENNFVDMANKARSDLERLPRAQEIDPNLRWYVSDELYASTVCRNEGVPNFRLR